MISLHGLLRLGRVKVAAAMLAAFLVFRWSRGIAMPLTPKQRQSLCDKLNGTPGPDQATWLDDDDEFDLINDRLDSFEDALSDTRNMVRAIFDKLMN